MERSAILTFTKLSFAFETFVLSIFEWPLKTDLLYKNRIACILKEIKLLVNSKSKTLCTVKPGNGYERHAHVTERHEVTERKSTLNHCKRLH